MPVKLLIQHGSPYWWESPAIWVVPGVDPNGVAGTPVAGGAAYLWATVTNEGDVDVDAQNAVQVDFWVANPSLQIRKSTSNHIGTSFVGDLPAGASQDVLCVVPWNVTFINGGHECVVVEASYSTDPLSPTPVDPDLLDAQTYRQIAQHNLSVLQVSGQLRHRMLIEFSPGARTEGAITVEVSTTGQIARAALKSLGLPGHKKASPGLLSAHLSELSRTDMPVGERRKSLKLSVARGKLAAVCLNLGVHKSLTADKYAVVRVTARQLGRVIGGVSIVIVGPERKKKEERSTKK